MYSTKNCQSCHTNLLPNALYCHNCGKQADGEGIVCFSCQNVNPASSRFCARCGTAINVQYTPSPNVTPVYGLDFNDIPTLPTQLREAFRVFVRLAVDLENNQAQELPILSMLEESDFRQKYLEEETVLMTQEFEAWFEERGVAAFTLIEQFIDQKFLILLERFWVNYCPELTPFPLPKATLHYQEASLNNSNLQRLIVDYLAIENDKLLAYTNAIEIPLKKLKNARTAFFKPQAGETPYLFIDQTLLRSGKEGCILTSKAIYWKAYFQRAAVIRYANLERLNYQADHLEINGIYFNISPHFNYKLYRLLSRLKSLV
ncbi:MAG: zinc ribbon domain-containing protein [Aureispira sp.]